MSRIKAQKNLLDFRQVVFFISSENKDKKDDEKNICLKPKSM
jgi:hypothetical protein